MVKNEGEKKNFIVVAAHVEIPGPVQALQRYIKTKGWDFQFIDHPLESSGKTRIETSSHKRSLWNPPIKTMRYVFHFVYNILYARKAQTYVGIDPLNALAGIVLRGIGRADKVVYYVIDYTPQRFSSPFLNFLYHLIDRICTTNADVVWCISERILEQKKKYGFKSGCVVPVGVYEKDIPSVSYQKIEDGLVIASHLTEEKGIQLAIKAMKQITKKRPKATLTIYGCGPYEETLKRLAKEEGVEKQVVFRGLVEHAKLLSELPRYCLALAPYVEDKNSITYYADPTKPKEYLACGLPVVITRLPWIAEEIEKKEMGRAIHYDEKELAEAVIELLEDPVRLQKMSENAKQYMKSYEWNKIFDNAFKSSK